MLLTVYLQSLSHCTKKLHICLQLLRTLHNEIDLILGMFLCQFFLLVLHSMDSNTWRWRVALDFTHIPKINHSMSVVIRGQTNVTFCVNTTYIVFCCNYSWSATQNTTPIWAFLLYSHIYSLNVYFKNNKNKNKNNMIFVFRTSFKLCLFHVRTILSWCP